MKITFPWTKRIADRRSFFDELYKSSASLNLDANLIKILEVKCRDGVSGWKSEIYSLLIGVKAGIEISGYKENSTQIEEIEKLLKLLEKVQPKDFMAREWILIFMAATSAIAVGYSRLLSSGNIFLTVLALLGISLAILGLWYGYKFRNNYKNDACKISKSQRITIGFGYSIMIFVFVFGASETAQKSVFGYTKYLAEKDMKEIVDDKELFPFFKSFLKNNYEMHLVMGDSGENWLNTYFNIESVYGSPASIRSNGDYCELYFSTLNLDNWSGVVSEHLRKIFQRAVFAHELGHCVGLSNDFQNIRKGNAQLYPVNLSVYPGEREKVSEIESLIEMSESINTKRWREVVSDLFAIGFVKKYHPEHAEQIRKEIMRIRFSAKHDFIHNTVCWLEHVKDKTPPENASDLYEWAVTQSMEPEHCKIEKPKK